MFGVNFVCLEPQAFSRCSEFVLIFSDLFVLVSNMTHTVKHMLFMCVCEC